MAKVKKKALELKYHHGDLRRAIMEAALALIEEAGIQNLSLREIARKIGVTTAAPYYHFKDREALLIQIAIQGYGELLKSLESARGSVRAGKDELEAEARAYLRFAQEHGALYAVMFSVEVAMKYEYVELKGTADRCFAVVCGSIAKRRKLGLKESAEAALCAWSLLHGFTVLDRSNFLEEERSEQERIAVAGVLSVVRGFSSA